MRCHDQRDHRAQRGRGRAEVVSRVTRSGQRCHRGYRPGNGSLPRRQRKSLLESRLHQARASNSDRSRRRSHCIVAGLHPAHGTVARERDLDSHAGKRASPQGRLDLSGGGQHTLDPARSGVCPGDHAQYRQAQTGRRRAAKTGQTAGPVANKTARVGGGDL